MATSDADRSVRVATIGLLDNIRKRDLLEPEDIDAISLMIFDSESRIRRAVVSIFLSNVDAMYEEMCENIGGSAEAVENELGNDKDSADGVPSTWLKLKAFVRVLTKYDQMVEEVEQEKADETKLPYKSFELGDVESRISQAAFAVFAEMDELHVRQSSFWAYCRIGITSPLIYYEITHHARTSKEDPRIKFCQRLGKPVL